MGRLFRLWVRAGPAIAAAASHRQAFNRRRHVPAISAETAVVARDLAESSAIFYMRATLHGRKPPGAGPAFAQIVMMTGLQTAAMKGRQTCTGEDSPVLKLESTLGPGFTFSSVRYGLVSNWWHSSVMQTVHET